MPVKIWWYTPQRAEIYEGEKRHMLEKKQMRGQVTSSLGSEILGCVCKNNIQGVLQGKKKKSIRSRRWKEYHGGRRLACIYFNTVINAMMKYK